MNIDFWRGYATSWTAPEQERGRLLSTYVSAEISYRDPLVEIHGREDFSQYMDAFQQNLPGHRIDILDVEVHHDRSLARWQIVDPDGNPVSPGISHAVHDDQNRFRDIAGFFATP